MESKHYKPFKQFREMDDEQKRKISDNPNLHRPKSDLTKQRISQAMKARWAATPSRKNGGSSGTTIDDLVF
jgi:hypothetical protein